MRIAFFSSGLAYRLGGPSFSEALLIRELLKSVDVDVYVPSESAEDEFLNDYEIKNVNKYRPAKVLEYREKLKASTLIHLNGHWKWWYASISKFASVHGIPYVLHPRGMLLVGHRRKQLKKVFNFAIGNSIVQNAARIIALSEYERNQFAPYKLGRNLIEVIPNPIPMEKKGPLPKPDLPKGVQSYFLYLGRIESRKNLVFLVKAFKEYRGLGGKSSLLIVGPVERDYDAEVRESIRGLSLESVIYVLPPAYELERDRLLQHSAALVYPANDEPFGRVPFEGVAVGTVPVVPDRSGSAEYLAPFFPECIFRENDAMDLGKTLIAAESLDRLRVEEAKTWIAKHLNSEAIGDKVLSLYQSIAQTLQSPLTSPVNRDLSPSRFTKGATD